MDRPIPAFYCCYLLRSTVRHSSLYVGSTPNPVRRLRQHNGNVKGGAVRTSRDSLRPWEMSCIVVGFPSKIAALQFEWAWQNTHISRHISAEERITRMNTKSRISPKTGRKITRVTRPRMSLTDRLTNLHILLCAHTFQRWPLHVRFFCKDVHKMWTRIVEQRLPLPFGSDRVILDVPEQLAGELPDLEIPAPLAAIDPTYQQYKNGLQHSLKVLTQDHVNCHCCSADLDKLKDLILICPHESCGSTFHASCLSQSFLAASPDELVPTQGACPSCDRELSWSDLARNLSLRVRGIKEQAELMKEKGRSKKQTDPDAAAAALVDSLPIAEEDNAPEDEIQVGSATFRRPRQSLVLSPTEVALDDVATTSDAVEPAAKKRGRKPKTPAKVVDCVSDSDWDRAEVL